MSEPRDNPAATFSLGGDFPYPALAQPTDIGPYHLIEVIGEGGMGVVYKAEQREPVRRVVALKLIKLGMDTREVIARFESERQALAMMNHPNVAKVLDAGATDGGRPYFVMEYVAGVPITQFCDANLLPIFKRLEEPSGKVHGRAFGMTRAMHFERPSGFFNLPHPGFRLFE